MIVLEQQGRQKSMNCITTTRNCVRTKHWIGLTFTAECKFYLWMRLLKRYYLLMAVRQA